MVFEQPWLGSVTLEGFVSGTEYECCVYATNEAGDGPCSNNTARTEEGNYINVFLLYSWNNSEQ